MGKIDKFLLVFIYGGLEIKDTDTDILTQSFKFDSGSGHTKDFRKLVFTASCLALSIKDSVKTKPASSLVVSLGKALNGIPPSCVVERW